MIEFVLKHQAVEPRGDELEAHVEAVMDALVDEAHVADCAINADLQTGRVKVSVSIETDSIEKATRMGLVAIRSAIHAAGGGTPGWDQVFEELGSQTEKVPA